ncbi:MAG TPA: DNA polymerase IV [Gemmataceae bacterium]|nr:DNA polymerase IV [Gemmataceae bacterium]
MPLTLCDRAILHLDADAFFASIEQRDDPNLRGKPVAVGTGVVASCSYEARRYGVCTGMRLAEARHLCRPLIVIPGEYPRYEQTARRILAVCQEQTPLIEVAALDDLYLDLTRQGGITQVASGLGTQIQDEVQLSVSIGIGSSKLIASVATKEAKQRKSQSAEWKKPTAVNVPAGNEQSYLAPWPARVLPGVGPKVEARLDRLNVRQVGEVAAIPVPILRGLFRAQGRLLHEQAHGIDPRPVQPRKPPQSVSRRTSFDPPVADRAFLRAMLDYLLERAAAWMRFHDLAAKGFVLILRYGDYQHAEGRGTFRLATDRDEALKEAVRERFEVLYQRRLPLRLLGVELTPLGSPERQPALFPDPDEERARRLATCKDAIRHRFGFTALLSGSALLLAEKLDHDRENFRLRTPCLTR